MLTCVLCTRRALRNLSFNLELSCNQYFRPNNCRAYPRTQFLFRNHATLRAIRTGHHRRELAKAMTQFKKTKDRPHALKSKRLTARDRLLQKDEIARAHNRSQLTNGPPRSGLIFTDRVELANAVLKKLKAEKLQDALALVRANNAPVEGALPMNIVVSWNHIVDWLMMKGDPKQAWRVYNEMKKRGHKPDPQTFTILLHGYRQNFKAPNAVKQAVDVYNSIFAANSPVKPTIIHTNAVLAVCARSHDMDSLWNISGRLRHSGAQAPDRITYTTILTAILADARRRALQLGSKFRAESPEDRARDREVIFERAVEDGIKLWTDVVTRWRRGDLEIDDDLVCAMGRLLMLSSQRRHHQEILALVEQTMNIMSTDKGLDRSTAESGESDSHTGEPGEESASSTALSTPIGSAYTVPSANTLSMLIETATSLRQVETGKRYWSLLTARDGPYRIVPDVNNIVNYLRLLRISRASRETLDLLRSLPESIWRKLTNQGTFIIAMSTCVRDKNNPNIFSIASQILDLMQEKLESYIPEAASSSDGRISQTLSPKILKNYLQLATASTRGLDGEALTKTKSGDLDFERDPSKNNALRALKRLGPSTLNVKELINIHMAEYERQSRDRSRTPTVQRLLQERAEMSKDVQELKEYLTTLVSVYDKLLLVNEKLEDEGLGPLDRETLREINSQKRKLSAFVFKIDEVSGMRSNTSKLRRTREVMDESIAGKIARAAQAEPSEELIDSGPRGNIEETLAARRKSAEAKMATRGLSRRQKREFEKESRLRAKFQTTLQRPSSKTMESKPVRTPRGKRGRPNPSLEKMIEKARSEMAIDFSVESREQSTTGSSSIRFTNLHPLDDDLKVQRPVRLDRVAYLTKHSGHPRVTKGWGGEFEKLARKQGQGSSGLFELYNTGNK